MYSANKCWLITFYVPGPGPTLRGRHKTHRTSSRNFTPLEGPGMHNEIQNVVLTVTFRFQRNSLKAAFLSRWNQERRDFWQQSPVGEAANKWREIISQEGWDREKQRSGVLQVTLPHDHPTSYLDAGSPVELLGSIRTRDAEGGESCCYSFINTEDTTAFCVDRYRAWERKAASCGRDFPEGAEGLSDCSRIVARLKCGTTHGKTFLSPEPLKEVNWSWWFRADRVICAKPWGHQRMSLPAQYCCRVWFVRGTSMGETDL